MIGKYAHKQAHNYHTGKDYDKAFLEPYTQKYSVNYRQQSEQMFFVRLNGYPLPFLGYFDGVTEGKVMDLKYALSCPSLKKNIQGILYSVVYKQKRGKYPQFLINHWNKKTNKIRNNACVYTATDEKWLWGKVDEFMEMLESPMDHCLVDGWINA